MSELRALVAVGFGARSRFRFRSRLGRGRLIFLRVVKLRGEVLSSVTNVFIVKVFRYLHVGCVRVQCVGSVGNEGDDPAGERSTNEGNGKGDSESGELSSVLVGA